MVFNVEAREGPNLWDFVFQFWAGYCSDWQGEEPGSYIVASFFHHGLNTVTGRAEQWPGRQLTYFFSTHKAIMLEMDTTNSFLETGDLIAT